MAAIKDYTVYIGRMAKINPDGRFSAQARRTKFSYGKIISLDSYNDRGQWFTIIFPDSYQNSYTLNDVILKPDEWDD